MNGVANDMCRKVMEDMLVRKLLKGFIGLLHDITEYSGYLQASKFTTEVLRRLISLLTDLTARFLGRSDASHFCVLVLLQRTAMPVRPSAKGLSKYALVGGETHRGQVVPGFPRATRSLVVFLEHGSTQRWSSCKLIVRLERKSVQ